MSEKRGRNCIGERERDGAKRGKEIGMKGSGGKMGEVELEGRNCRFEREGERTEEGETGMKGVVGRWERWSSNGQIADLVLQSSFSFRFLFFFFFFFLFIFVICNKVPKSLIMDFG